jgi:ABC-type molybdate transport system permease subunit
MEPNINNLQDSQIQQVISVQSTEQSTKTISLHSISFRSKEIIFRTILLIMIAVSSFVLSLIVNKEIPTGPTILIALILVLPPIVVGVFLWVFFDSLFFLKSPVRILFKKDLLHHYLASSLRVLGVPALVLFVSHHEGDIFLNSIMVAPYWLGLLIIDMAIVYETDVKSKRNYFILSFIIITVASIFEYLP